jgi:hypothetical protein
MLFWEVIAVYPEYHMIPIITLHEKNAKLQIDKAGGTFTAGLIEAKK